MTKVICYSLQTMQPTHVPRACVLCLGNFDGVHLAHRALMQTATELRAHRFSDAACGAFCFDPPSSDFLLSAPPAHLCTREEKLKKFREAGLEYAFLANFEALRDLSPEEYVNEILKDTCHCVAAVCGFNHRFGRGGEGTPALLSALLDGNVEIQKEIMHDGEPVSSSRIRALLTDGKTEAASTLLTIPYTLTAKVVHGKSLGHKWGFPTVNQPFPTGKLIPRHGVYVTDCILPDGTRKRGVSNVGNHPTVDREANINCETYLFDFDGSLYGEAVTVQFLHFLRPEQKFENADALRAQIALDLEAARTY